MAIANRHRRALPQRLPVFALEALTESALPEVECLKAEAPMVIPFRYHSHRRSRAVACTASTAVCSVLYYDTIMSQ